MLDLYTREQLNEIRKQYEMRLEDELRRREELEWLVRMELANLRYAETHARQASRELGRIHEVLRAVLGEAAHLAYEATPLPVAPQPRSSPAQLTKSQRLAPPSISQSPDYGSSSVRAGRIKVAI